MLISVRECTSSASPLCSLQPLLSVSVIVGRQERLLEEGLEVEM